MRKKSHRKRRSLKKKKENVRSLKRKKAKVRSLRRKSRKRMQRIRAQTKNGPKKVTSIRTMMSSGEPWR